MEIKPLVGISYELIFQIFNSLVVLAILILIVYGIYCLISKFKGKKKYENKIVELENKLKELEDKIDSNKM